MPKPKKSDLEAIANRDARRLRAILDRMGEETGPQPILEAAYHLGMVKGLFLALTGGTVALRKYARDPDVRDAGDDALKNMAAMHRKEQKDKSITVSLLRRLEKAGLAFTLVEPAVYSN